MLDNHLKSNTIIANVIYAFDIFELHHTPILKKCNPAPFPSFPKDALAGRRLWNNPFHTSPLLPKHIYKHRSVQSVINPKLTKLIEFLEIYIETTPQLPPGSL